jgi:HAD-hyrolase-like
VIVAVGDSVEHDVRGANGMEIDCCFVTGGIHAERFSTEATAAEREASLADLPDGRGCGAARPVPAYPGDDWRPQIKAGR